MEFKHETWPIGRIVDVYTSSRLILNPPYQRNPIWSVRAQKMLLETIFRGWPMPSFFLLDRGDGTFEVVDGQQRARTILGFCKGQLTTKDGRAYADAVKIDDGSLFRDYRLSVTVIKGLSSNESIEKFYALVNSTGLRLNRPEVRKAEFYSTVVLRLVTSVASLPAFQELGLFTRLSAQRMNDIEFVAELVGLLRYGIVDKKDNIDDMFEDDISESEHDAMFAECCRIISVISRFNAVVPLAKTRYRQKNDFYTLFGFLHEYKQLSEASLGESYRLLLKLDIHIRPSQERCEPLMKYAFNCVTQSNSKKAREERYKFFVDLLANDQGRLNCLQEAILAYFRAKSDAVVMHDGFTSIDANKLRDPDYDELPITRD